MLGSEVDGSTNFKTFLKNPLLLQSELIFIQIVVDNSIVKFFYLGQ